MQVLSIIKYRDPWYVGILLVGFAARVWAEKASDDWCLTCL